MNGCKTRATDIKTTANELREHILKISRATLILKTTALQTNAPAKPGDPVPDPAEMCANAMLAYRHLEDARMRLGKVIQAFEGGVSCYDPKAGAA